MNEEEAEKNPFFEGRVAHGYLIVSFAAGLFVDPDFGPVLANYGVDDLRFIQPVNYGDSLKVRLACKQKTLRGDSGYGEVRWDAEVTNQDDEIVAQYDVLFVEPPLSPRERILQQLMNSSLRTLHTALEVAGEAASWSLLHACGQGRSAQLCVFEFLL